MFKKPLGGHPNPPLRTGRVNTAEQHDSYTDDIIILLNYMFTRLHGYQIMPGLSTDKRRHRLLLLKTGIHLAPTHLLVMLSFGNTSRD